MRGHETGVEERKAPESRSWCLPSWYVGFTMVTGHNSVTLRPQAIAGNRISPGNSEDPNCSGAPHERGRRRGLRPLTREEW